MAPSATNSPAVNSRESPGRKNPSSRPHSAKMINASPTRAHGPSHVKIVSGLSHSGPSAMTCTIVNGTDG